MEEIMISIFLSLALVALQTCAWRVGNWAWIRPKELERLLRDQGFKGNPYKPFHGDAKEMISVIRETHTKPMDVFSDDIVPHVLPFHHRSISRHGKMYMEWIGPTPKANIMDPRLIKDILFNYHDFRKPEFNPLLLLVFSGMLVYEGEKLAKHRSIVNPAFHLEKLKHMVGAMYLSCSEMISEWEALLPTKGSCEVDVNRYFIKLSADVISRTAFGSNFEEGKRIFELLAEQIHITMTEIVSLLHIPGWRFLPTKANTRVKTIHREMAAAVRGVVTKRMRATQGKDGDGVDLVGILLKRNMQKMREQENKKNVTLSIEEVIDECKLFYIAGQESTSYLLVWTMVLLSKHQKWQALAREEILAVFGGKKPDFDGLSQLKIITMILYEVLRLYSPAPPIHRKVRKKVKLGEYVIPPGVELYIPTIAIHHNTELWGEDAKEFKPERFSGGVWKATKGQNMFIPFSAGPRVCIGQNFTMLEAKLVLAAILQRFSFQLSPSYVHCPSLVLTLQPQYGAPLILQKI